MAGDQIKSAKLWVFSNHGCSNCKKFLNETYPKFAEDKKRGIPLSINGQQVVLGGRVKFINQGLDVLKHINAEIVPEGNVPMTVSDIVIPDSVPAFYLQTDIVGKPTKMVYLGTFSDETSVSRDYDTIRSTIINCLSTM